MGERTFKRIFTRKRLIIASLILLPVVVVSLLRAYLRSQAFNSLVAQQIQRAALEQGLDLRVGSFGLNWDSYTATLQDLTLRNRANGLLVARLSNLSLSIDVENVLSERALHLKHARVDGLEVYYTVDEQGRGSLDGLAEKRSEDGGLIKTDRFKLQLQDFTLRYSDPKLKTTVAGSGLVRFSGDGAEIEAQGRSVLTLASGALPLEYSLRTRLDGKRLFLDALKVDSELLRLETSGALEDGGYDLRFKSLADLKLLTLLTPDRLDGRVEVSGKVKGRGADYALEAQLQSPQIATRLGSFDLSVKRLKVSPHNRVARVELEELKMERFSSSEVTAKNISGERLVLELGHQSTFSAPELRVARLTSGGFSASQIRVRDVESSLLGSAVELRAGLAVDVLSGGGAKLERVETGVKLVRDTLEIDALKARLAGGLVKASGKVPIKSGSGRVDIEYDGLQLAAIVQGLPESTLSGRARIDLKSFTQLSARVDGLVASAAMQGDYSVSWDGRAVHLSRLELKTARSRISASGALSEAAAVTFNIASEDAAELQAFALNVPQVKMALEPALKYRLQLTGGLKINGTVSGGLKSPEVEVRAELSQVALHQESFGPVTALVKIDRGTTRVSATIEQGDGKLRLDASLPEDLSTVTIYSSIERVRLERLLKAAAVNALSGRLAGYVNAEVALENLSLKDFTSRGRVELWSDELTVSGRSLKDLRLLLGLRADEIAIERLDARLDPGHLRGSGRVDTLRQGFQFELRAPLLDLNALAREVGFDKVKVSGAADARLQLEGSLRELDRVSLNLKATAPALFVNDKSAGAVTLSAVTQNNRLDIDLITDIVGKPQPLKATVDLADEFRAVSVEANFADIDIADLSALYDPAVAKILKGRVTGRVKLKGSTLDEFGQTSLDKLEGSLEIERLNLAVAEQEIPVVTPVTFKLRRKRVEVTPVALKGQGIDLLLNASLSNIYEKPSVNLTVKGSLTIEQTRFIDRLGSGTSLGGRLLVDAGLSGALEDPKLTGEVRLRRFFLTIAGVPVEVERGNARVEFQGDKAVIKTLRARSGEGYILGAGVVRLERLKPVEWSLDLETDALETYYQGVSAQLVARLKLNGSPIQQTIRGQIEIPRAEYQSDFDLGALLAGNSGAFSSFDPGFASASLPTKLDIKIEANESLLIRNGQLNTIGSAKLNLVGSVDSPQLTGLISLEGGSIVFRKQKYTIEQGTLQFLDGAGAVAYLNLLAQSRIDGYDITLGLRGPVDKIEVDLRSEPALSRSEILSLITTGRLDSGALNTQDVIGSGVSSAASLLSEELISKQAERLLGLSSFKVDPVLKPNSNPAARVTISKKLSKDLELTYSTNLSSDQEQTGIVEYNLSSRFSALASITQGGTGTSQSDTSLLFEVRGRRRFGVKPVLTPTMERLAVSKRPAAEVVLEQPAGISISRGVLRELIPVYRQGYSRPLARLGERNLTDYLQREGYFFANVRHRCEPVDCAGTELKLVYQIDSPGRYYLREIRVEGTQKLSKRDVIGKLKSREARFFGGLPVLKGLPYLGGYGRGLTSVGMLREDAEVIKAMMQEQGYLRSSVDFRLAFTSDLSDPVVIFNVTEGPYFSVTAIEIEGNRRLPTERLRAVLKLKEGDPLAPSVVSSGLTRLKDLYASEGYLDAKAELKVELEGADTGRVKYLIEEGELSKVTQIEVVGQNRTDEARIRDFLGFHIGQVLTPKLMQHTQRDLYATGAFSEVSIRTAASRVQLRVTEAKPLLFVYGLGYSTEEGPRGLLQLTHNNLFGKLRSGTLQLRSSLRQQLLQAKVTDPRAFGSQWSTTLAAFYNRDSDLRPFTRKTLDDAESRSARAYGVRRVSLFAQTERKLNTSSSLRLRYNYEDVRLFNISGIPEAEIARSAVPVRLGVLSAGVTRDTRDNPINPATGWLLSADHSLAARILGGNEQFNKFYGNVQAYHTFGTSLLKDSTLAFVARVGLARSFSPRDVDGDGSVSSAEERLPISERFFAGGATTLRGFRFEMAGPQVILEPRNANELPTLIPVGGNALAMFNFELRYPLSSSLRLVPFYDLGNVFSRVSDIGWKQMTNTVGLGVRFNTPIGPVGIDYGYLLDPPGFRDRSGGVIKAPRGVIHIRFGQTF